jgi:hypothetical protein
MVGWTISTIILELSKLALKYESRVTNQGDAVPFRTELKS